MTHHAPHTYQISLLQIVHNCSVLHATPFVSQTRAGYGPNRSASRSRLYKNTFASAECLTDALRFEKGFRLQNSFRASVENSQTHVPCGAVYTQVGLH